MSLRPTRRELVRWACAVLGAAALFASDAVTKSWAESELGRFGSRPVLGGAIRLRYQKNSGIAFGLFHAPTVYWKRNALVAYAGAVTLGLAVILARRLRDPGAGRGMTAGLVLLLSGAGGNLYDRITRGAVVDFIDPQLPRGLPWPAFNLADVYLFVGIGVCVIALLRAHREELE